MRRIACGFVCVDIYPQYERVSIGGQCVNLTIATALSEDCVEFVGRVGNDAVGGCVVQTLEQLPNTKLSIRELAGKSAHSVIVVRDGERSFAAGDKGVYSSDFPRFDIDDLCLDESPVAVHLDFSTAYLLSELNARSGVLTSIDRLGIAALELYELADVNFISIGADASAAEVAKRIEARIGSRVFVITQGSRGSFALSDGKLFHSPALPIDVLDTTGAGDAFAAGFMREYTRSRDVAASLEAGAEFGAKACAHYGANVLELDIDDDIKREKIAFAHAALDKA